MIYIPSFNPYKFFEPPTLISEERLNAFQASDKKKAAFELQELDRYHKTLNCLKVKSDLRDADLFEIIRLIEMELFPELGTDYGYDGRYLDGVKFGGKYVYFAPSYSFNSGLIDESILNDLFTNTSLNILSVGSGSPYLEKLLLAIDAVKKENLVISDIDSKDLPEDLNRAVFDMNGQWPDFGRKFNLIIFPESLCGVRDASDSEGCYDFIGNKYPWSDEKMKKSANMAYLGIYNVIKKAIKHLAPLGQIRMTTQAGIGKVLPAFERKLKEEGYNFSVFGNSKDGLIIAKSLS